MAYRLSSGRTYGFPLISSVLPTWAKPSDGVAVGAVGDGYELDPNEDPQTFFDTHDVVALKPGTSYLFNGVRVKGSKVIYGSGATVKAASKDTPCLIIDDRTSKMTVYDVTFKNDAYIDRGLFMHQVIDKGCGIYSRNSDGVSVSNCTFSGFNCAGIFIFDDVWPGQTSNRHHVTTCNFEACRAGLYVQSQTYEDGAFGNTVIGCSFVDCKYGIYAVTCIDWVITACAFRHVGSAFFHVYGRSMAFGSTVATGYDRRLMTSVFSNCVMIDCLSFYWPNVYFDEEEEEEKPLYTVHYSDEGTGSPLFSSLYFYNATLLAGYRNVRDKNTWYTVADCQFWWDDSYSDKIFISGPDPVSGVKSMPEVLFTGCFGRTNTRVKNLGKRNFRLWEWISFPTTQSNSLNVSEVLSPVPEESCPLSPPVEKPPEDLPSTLPEKPPEDLPSTLPEKPPEDLPSTLPEKPQEDLPSTLPEKPPEDLPSTLPEKPPEDLPSTLPEKPPEDLPSTLPEKPQEDLPSTLPEKPPEDLPSTLPEKPPEDLPSTLPEKPPEDLPSTLPEKPQEDLPSTLPEKPPEDRPSILPEMSPENVPSILPEGPRGDLPSVLPQRPDSDQPSVAPACFPATDVMGDLEDPVVELEVVCEGEEEDEEGEMEVEEDEEGEEEDEEGVFVDPGYSHRPAVGICGWGDRGSKRDYAYVCACNCRFCVCTKRGVKRSRFE
ncbi:E1B protein large T-antigen [Barthadenovirus mellis]|uniref:E1B protein large T-antigen n=1 Tax=Passerine adenovirus 1 TaxID=2779174 RepID=A0A7L9DK44_9ADEN|nr:E1B protein large T-antigen [Passerine adenovirus 1]